MSCRQFLSIPVFFFQGRCRLYFTKQRSREITISLIAKGFRCTTIIILWRTWCFLFLESLTLVNRRLHIYDSLNWENYSRKYLQVNDFLTYLYNKIKISTMCSSVIDLFFIYLFIWKIFLEIFSNTNLYRLC